MRIINICAFVIVTAGVVVLLLSLAPENQGTKLSAASAPHTKSTPPVRTIHRSAMDAEEQLDDAIADRAPIRQVIELANGDTVEMTMEPIDPDQVDQGPDPSQILAMEQAAAAATSPTEPETEPVDPRDEGFESLEDMEAAVRSRLGVPDSVAVTFSRVWKDGRPRLRIGFEPIDGPTPQAWVPGD